MPGKGRVKTDIIHGTQIIFGGRQRERESEGVREKKREKPTAGTHSHENELFQKFIIYTKRAR